MHATPFRAFIFFLWLLPVAAQAQDDACAAIDAPPIATTVAPRDRLNALEQRDCLGGGLDNADLTRDIVSGLPDGRAPRSPGVSDEERRAATLQALDKINAAITAQITALPAGVEAAGGERLRTLQNALLAARDKIATGGEGEGLHRPVYWKFDPNSGGFKQLHEGAPHIDISLHRGFLDEACVERDSALCADTYAASQQIVRDARLIERTLTYYAAPIIDMNYREALKRDKQWDAYFDEALFQYPWELVLNGLWINKHDPRPRDAAGNPLGFLPPPSAQWIVFHPNVGFEYLGSAADGNQFEPTVFVELIGYNRWRWSAAGEIENALGISLITNYSDRAGADDVGYGVMLHYRNSWSLAVTRHDEETGVLLSADLAQYVSGASDKARKLLRFGK